MWPGDISKVSVMADIEFFFDCSSPWTYLAFHNIQPLAAEFRATVAFRPILVGGIFNTVNPSVYASRENKVPLKQAYGLKDMQDWARIAGIRIVHPPKVFPVNSVKAMRGCLLLKPKGLQVAFAQAAFAAYFGDDKDISKDEVLAEICAQVGVDAKSLLAGIGQQATK